MKFTNRFLKLPSSRSFFLFGARNTGKSTLLKHIFETKGEFWIDLLDPNLEDRYSSRSLKSIHIKVLEERLL